MSEAGKNNLTLLGELGLTVDYQVVDVADKSAVEQLMKNIQTTYQQLTGIFHCAGVVRDNFIIKKSLDEISSKIDLKL